MGDYDAAATVSNVATCTTTTTKVTCVLTAACIAAMAADVENQFRVALVVQTNTNKLADYITFYSGESTVTNTAPLLVLTTSTVAASPSPVVAATPSRTATLVVVRCTRK